MLHVSAATERLLKFVKLLWIFPTLILAACGTEPRPPEPVVVEEIGNFQDLAKFDRVPTCNRCHPSNKSPTSTGLL